MPFSLATDVPFETILLKLGLGGPREEEVLPQIGL